MQMVVIVTIPQAARWKAPERNTGKALTKMLRTKAVSQVFRAVTVSTMVRSVASLVTGGVLRRTVRTMPGTAVCFTALALLTGTSAIRRTGSLSVASGINFTLNLSKGLIHLPAWRQFWQFDYLPRSGRIFAKGECKVKFTWALPSRAKITEVFFFNGILQWFTSL